ncbi:hypothetical protein NliqN6_5972 [Naganishia liquefaciens]|uniref:Uncharacterized protein n=1 Tax=Naganishia liquefaciens TaxID=104408 RepID=A0A8H3TYJ4_9TREE|nr:hypothetical protein NliqN6_5972 [Naganishia liquefaciens]
MGFGKVFRGSKRRKSPGPPSISNLSGNPSHSLRPSDPTGSSSQSSPQSTSQLSSQGPNQCATTFRTLREALEEQVGEAEAAQISGLTAEALSLHPFDPSCISRSIETDDTGNSDRSNPLGFQLSGSDGEDILDQVLRSLPSYVKQLPKLLGRACDIPFYCGWHARSGENQVLDTLWILISMPPPYMAKLQTHFLFLYGVASGVAFIGVFRTDAEREEFTPLLFQQDRSKHRIVLDVDSLEQNRAIPTPLSRVLQRRLDNTHYPSYLSLDQVQRAIELSLEFRRLDDGTPVLSRHPGL